MKKHRFGHMENYVKAWGREPNDGKHDPDLHQQKKQMARLPMIHHHVALMPDAHLGQAVPIGTVLPLKDAIIPNAIGVDQFCGMRFKLVRVREARENGIPSASVLQMDTANGKLGKSILNDLNREIQVGAGKYNPPDKYEEEMGELMDYWQKQVLERDAFMTMPDDLVLDIRETAQKSLGTLGSGNHFVELQRDLNGDIGMMIHTGSRGFGYKVSEFYSELAEKKNRKWRSDVPDYGLAFLPFYSDIGQEFYGAMKVAGKFAELNRRIIMDEFTKAVKRVFDRHDVGTSEFCDEVKCNHNYADLENHYGENVIVHRKGAIRARKGDRGIIPGAMGSYSYIVEGKGNEESFHSASHGAGRKMSRTEAKETLSTQEMMEEFKENDMFLIAKNKEETLDEYRKAYKDIEDVMDRQKDLVDVDRKLETVGVLKG